MPRALWEGDTVVVVADGKDEEAAVESIGNYLSGKTE